VRQTPLVSGAASLRAAALAATAAPHAEAPRRLSSGCPARYQLLQLGVDLTREAGYRAVFDLDAAGNANGYVCGLPLPDAACVALAGGPCPVPVFYNFVDDTITKR
jgi:hypothetical protein